MIDEQKQKVVAWLGKVKNKVTKPSQVLLIEFHDGRRLTVNASCLGCLTLIGLAIGLIIWIF